MYEYKATVVRIIDGDTAIFDIDCGFNLWLKSARVRLNGINCPRLKESGGKEAKEFVESVLPAGTKVIIETIIEKRDKYSRILGTVWIGKDNLNEILIEKGFAEKYIDSNYKKKMTITEIEHKYGDLKTYFIEREEVKSSLFKIDALSEKEAFTLAKEIIPNKKKMTTNVFFTCKGWKLKDDNGHNCHQL